MGFGCVFPDCLAGFYRFGGRVTLYNDTDATRPAFPIPAKLSVPGEDFDDTASALRTACRLLEGLPENRESFFR